METVDEGGNMMLRESADAQQICHSTYMGLTKVSGVSSLAIGYAYALIKVALESWQLSGGTARSTAFSKRMDPLRLKRWLACRAGA